LILECRDFWAAFNTVTEVKTIILTDEIKTIVCLKSGPSTPTTLLKKFRSLDFDIFSDESKELQFQASFLNSFAGYESIVLVVKPIDCVYEFSIRFYLLCQQAIVSFLANLKCPP